MDFIYDTLSTAIDAIGVKNMLFASISLVGAWISKKLGGWDSSLKLLAGAMVLDYITGIIVAAFFRRSNKSESGALDSRAGVKGLFRKVGIVAAVWFCALLDEATGASYFRTMVVIFFSANEGLSLLENVGLMGVPYPAWLREALEVLRDKGDKGRAGKDEKSDG